MSDPDLDPDLDSESGPIPIPNPSNPIAWLIYKLAENTGVVVQTVEEALYDEAVHSALVDAKTWGEFRQLLPRGEWIRSGGAAGTSSGGKTSRATARNAGRKRHTVAGISSPLRLQPVQYAPSASACASPASNECNALCAGPQARRPTTSAATRPMRIQRRTRLARSLRRD